MKIIKAFIIICYFIAIVMIPVSFFNVEGKLIIGLIGYGALLVGGILTLILTYFIKKLNVDKDS